MGQFLNDLSSPYWWLSVVLVGIIINIVTEYLKPLIDKIWVAWSQRRRRKAQEEEAKSQKLRELLEEDSRRQEIWVGRMIDEQIRSNRYLVMALLLLVASGLESFTPGPSIFYTLILPIFAFTVYLRSQYLSKSATEKRLALRDVQENVAEKVEQAI